MRSWCTTSSMRNHEVYEDEDDSNDENNWRNEYPDEDPDKSKNI